MAKIKLRGLWYPITVSQLKTKNPPPDLLRPLWSAKTRPEVWIHLLNLLNFWIHLLNFWRLWGLRCHFLGASKVQMDPSGCV